MVTFWPMMFLKERESFSEAKSRWKLKRREIPSRPVNPCRRRTSFPIGVSIAISRFCCVYAMLSLRVRLEHHLTPGTAFVATLRYLRIHELPGITDVDVNRIQPFAFRQAAQNLSRDVRKKRIGQNVVHVAGTALDLSTTARDLVNQFVVIRQGDLMVLLNSPLNLIQLEYDDFLECLIAYRIVRNDHHAA